MKHNRHVTKSNHGFTLVELIIVIAIMAILAGAIAPALIRYIDKARKSNDKNTGKIIYDDINNLLASNDEWYDIWCDPWYPTHRSETKFSVTVGSESYNVEVMFTNRSKYNYAFWSSIKELQPLMDSLNKQLDLDRTKNGNANKRKVPVKYKKDSGLGKPSHWGVCRNYNSNRIEVWLMCEGKWDGIPTYRLYPDCCEEYQ